MAFFQKGHFIPIFYAADRFTGKYYFLFFIRCLQIPPDTFFMPVPPNMQEHPLWKLQFGRLQYIFYIIRIYYITQVHNILYITINNCESTKKMYISDLLPIISQYPEIYNLNVQKVKNTEIVNHVRTVRGLKEKTTKNVKE